MADDVGKDNADVGAGESGAPRGPQAFPEAQAPGQGPPSAPPPSYPPGPQPGPSGPVPPAPNPSLPSYPSAGGSAPPPPPGYPPPGAYGGQGGYTASPGYFNQSPYASYGARLGGWLIDWVILAVVGFAISAVFNAGRIATITFHTTTTVNGTTTRHVGHFSILAPILQIIIVLLYGALLCGSARGQTVGMMAVGARAVDRDAYTPIGFGRALGRAAFEYLLFILFFVPWVIDMLFPAWDGLRQTLHDKVTRTVVVKTSVMPRRADRAVSARLPELVALTP